VSASLPTDIWPKEKQSGKDHCQHERHARRIRTGPGWAGGYPVGGWFGEYGGADLAVWAKVEFEEAQHTDACLLGRRSDEWFASRWASRDDEWANKLNSLPKYVVSSTLEDAKWTNSTVLEGDVVESVSNLNEHLDGEIVVYASYQLVRTLIEHDLVDEFRLFVFPVLLGGGQRLFAEASEKTSLRLVKTSTVGEGLVFVNYEVTHRATV
jgi:dihydrofolate reductase